MKRFYETKRGDMRDQVREIRGKIEADLFDQWKNGDQSMYDVSRLLAALVAAIEERISGIDSKIVKASDESEEFKNNEKTIKDNRVEWSKLNWFSMTTLFDKDDKLLKAQGECYIIRHRMRTQLEGLRYAKDLLAQLRTDLQSLASEVSEAAAMISKAAKSYQAAIDTRCADEGSEDLSKQVIRFYDPQKIKDFAKSLTLDKTEQKKQTSKVRTLLADLLVDKQTFTAFNWRVTEGQFLDVVEVPATERARSARRVHLQTPRPAAYPPPKRHGVAAQGLRRQSRASADVCPEGNGARQELSETRSRAGTARGPRNSGGQQSAECSVCHLRDNHRARSAGSQRIPRRLLPCSGRLDVRVYDGGDERRKTTRSDATQ